ncbi:gluconokinase [Arsenicicoccus sp. oral taxon 190]|uniref:gluconokinase n=1 Tax=Arsenicicoccus sp. oral taxon 190 TaxID=1658671 RepID=UPI00067A2828|nr:gluconokinase [Arsenicicoccus sp. oral taxon 190]AKT51455.1 gluconate kinase [Arsenicicoccus sp. oral taxon 190]
MSSFGTTSATGRAAAPRVVVMGVTGCGKTTVGAALGQRLRVPFADADDFHPPANIRKMSAGIPLDDDDRAPWLFTLAQWLRDHEETGAVIGCSALKRSYRDILRSGAPDLTFLHLHGDREVVTARVEGRPGHFMPASLVDSQYSTLEALQHDEAGVTIDFALPVDSIVDDYVTAFPEQSLPGDPAVAAAGL